MLRPIACITYISYGWRQDANDPIPNLYDLHVDLFCFVPECVDFKSIIVGCCCNCHIRILSETETFSIIN